MSVLVFVDTNVLIYARDGRFPEKQARARAWLSALARASCMTISLQVIKEHHSVASRKLGLAPGAAAAATRDLLAWCTHADDQADVLAALDIQAKYKTSWWDALNLAAAIRLRATHFLIEDAQSAPMIEGVWIIDPFGQTPQDFFDER